MKSKFDEILQNEQSAKRNVALMKVIDTFSKLTLPDLTISSQNMYKGEGGRCQAPNNMTLKLASDLNLSERWLLMIANVAYLHF